MRTNPGKFDKKYAARNHFSTRSNGFSCRGPIPHPRMDRASCAQLLVEGLHDNSRTMHCPSRSEHHIPRGVEELGLKDTIEAIP